MNTLPERVYEHASRLVDYCPETGSMEWKRRNSPAHFNGRYAGTECGGSAACSRYRVIAVRVDGVSHRVLVHRLAWYIHHGSVPEQIDHINGNRLDNRAVNLRASNSSINTKNKRMPKSNTSGVTGVSWSKRNGKWRAKVTVDKKEHHVGLFEDIGEAERAVIRFRSKHGFTSRHGL